MAVGMFLPIGPPGDLLQLPLLPLASPLLGILVCYTLLTTLMKRYYLRKFGWQ